MIKSMTAFARKQTQQEIGTLNWEVRSVNSRYLDINFRLPELFRELEPKLRELMSKYLHRGKVDATLHYTPGEIYASEIVINKSAVEKINRVLVQINSIIHETGKTSPLEILRWPGVMQILESDKSGIFEIALNFFEKTLIDLGQTRIREGEKLKEFIKQRLDDVSKEISKVQECLPSILQSQREMLLTRFEEARVDLDLNRLEQEMVLLAQKMDVSEELDRLEIHVAEVKRMLKEGGQKGRRLDFLMQEMNREVNTLGSKSISEITTKASVELKVLIEQIREQVQNIE